jgi:23S rRNA pseudouridine1911/1915/1917 synthase
MEKEDYLVINKPKGVLSHPRNLREVNEPSVVGFLYHRYKDLPSIGNFIRAGLLHRLDKETDGLMIIAKTEK